MSRWTLILLLLLVGGLGFLAWRQRGQDRQFTQDSTVALFPGLTEVDVAAVRIDVVQRDVQARFVRDPKVGWRMTDPMQVRAEASVLDAVVRAALARSGTPVSEEELDPAKLGLSPPRIVLELEAVDGARHRLEIGALDLDGNRVNVRARGKVVRTMRDVETLLDAHLDQFQSHAATTLDPRDIVEIRRSGSLLRPDDLVPQNMGLEAVLDGDRWRMTKPFDVLLDPLAVSIYCGATAGLRFEGFVETGGASLASLGLEPPALTIELTSATGEMQRLRFGLPDRARPDRWVGLSESESTPWRAPEGIVFDLGADPLSFADHRLHRLPIGEIERVELSTSEHVIRLEKGMLGWAIQKARAGSSVFDKPVLADTTKVTDFLGKFERTEVRSFERNTAFDPSERRAAVSFVARGLEAGVVLGQAHPTGGVRALRGPDTLVSIVDDIVLELAQTPASAFWSDSIHDLAEVQLVDFTLRIGEHERSFQRDRTGVWVEKGRTSEARELRDVLDPLVFLRAARHLDTLAPPIADPLTVRFGLTNGTSDTLTFGRVEVDGTPLVVCDRGGRRSVLAKPELLDALAKIAGGP